MIRVSTLAAGLCGLLLHVGTPAQSQLPLGDVAVRMEPVVDLGLGGVVLINVQNARLQLIPIDITDLGDGRQLVLSLTGHVRLLRTGGSLAPGAYLDTRDPTRMPAEFDFTELGHTSIAAHPGFSDPSSRGFGRFYTLHTEEVSSAVTPDFDDGVNSVIDSVLYEWSILQPAQRILGEAFTARGASPTIARREILRSRRPGIIHTIVDMDFTPDEYLVLTSGDGGSPSTPPGSGSRQSPTAVALNPRSIFGTLLRIDPLSLPGNDPRPLSANGQYRIHPDNLGFQDSDPLTPGEVMAYGLRSPYRIHIDEISGDYWIGDVGQEERDEIHRMRFDANGQPIEDGQSGINFGWGRFEGTRFNANRSNSIAGRPYAAPIWELVHNTTPSEATNIIGGFIYRGAAFPELVGKYVFADTGENEQDQPTNTIDLYYGDPATSAASTRDDLQRMRLAVVGGATLPDRIWSMDQDPNGEILLLVGPPRGGDPMQPFRSLPSTTAPAILRVVPTCPSGVGGSDCASVASIGSGCAGSSGVAPSLTSPANGLPVFGSQWELVVDQAPSGALTALAFGFQASGALDLTALGAPGCVLQANPPVVLGIAPPVMGSTSLRVPIPVAATIGASVRAQAVVQDLAANPLGIVLSNPVEGTVGLR